MKPKHLHIFDIDGVLLCSKHRFKTTITESGIEKLDLDYWKDNQHKALQDTPLRHAEVYKKLLTQKNSFVIIATSRKMKAVDYQVIEEKLGEPHAYVSRVTDEQVTGLLKLNGILRLISDVQLPVKSVTIYEDSHENIRDIANGIKQHLNIDPVAYYIPSDQGI